MLKKEMKKSKLLESAVKKNLGQICYVSHSVWFPQLVFLPGLELHLGG